MVVAAVVVVAIASQAADSRLVELEERGSRLLEELLHSLLDPVQRVVDLGIHHSAGESFEVQALGLGI